MVYQWTTGFEEYPTPSDFGSTMCSAMTTLKSAFYERIITQHVWDAGSPPIMTHKAGYCSILDFQTAPVISSNIVGAMHSDGDALYADFGPTTGALLTGTDDHLSLKNTTADDHTMYLKIAGDTLNAALTVPTIRNVANGTVVNDAINRGQHLTLRADGSADHKDASITSVPGILIGREQTYMGTDSVVIAATGGAVVQLRALHDFASFPVGVGWPDTNSNNVFYVRPATTDYNDYIPTMKLELYSWFSTAGNYTFNFWYIV